MYFKLAVVLALSALISACSSGAGIGELVPLAGTDTASKPSSNDFNDSDDHLRIRHVMELRQRYRGSSDPAGLDELRRGETEAATHFLAAGSAFAREGRYQEAIEKYEMGLLAQPANAELQQARQTAAGRKELARLYTEGQRAKAVGNYDLAETLYQRAASFDGHDEGLKKGAPRSRPPEERRGAALCPRGFSPENPGQTLAGLGGGCVVWQEKALD